MYQPVMRRCAGAVDVALWNGCGLLVTKLKSRNGKGGAPKMGPTLEPLFLQISCPLPAGICPNMDPRE